MTQSLKIFPTLDILISRQAFRRNTLVPKPGNRPTWEDACEQNDQRPDYDNSENPINSYLCRENTTILEQEGNLDNVQDDNSNIPPLLGRSSDSHP